VRFHKTIFTAAEDKDMAERVALLSELLYRLTVMGPRKLEIICAKIHKMVEISGGGEKEKKTKFC
jgi:hypothetical protein